MHANKLHKWSLLLCSKSYFFFIFSFYTYNESLYTTRGDDSSLNWFPLGFEWGTEEKADHKHRGIIQIIRCIVSSLVWTIACFSLASVNIGSSGFNVSEEKCVEKKNSFENKSHSLRSVYVCVNSGGWMEVGKLEVERKRWRKCEKEERARLCQWEELQCVSD